MENYKVLITTSGVGSRLGNLTFYTNKCLIRVGKKPAISYIVENYPDLTEFVITLGYYGKHVKDFLELTYPNKKFTFIEIDNYEGAGSSLGYSLLQTKDYLQEPFIFHASDTIINEKIKSPSTNWIGVCEKVNHSQYRTVGIDTNLRIFEKGELGSKLAYIGLAGINDYQNFWKELEISYLKDPNNSKLSDCHSLNKIIDKDTWSVINFNSWLDVGNVSELKKSRESVSDKFEVLAKVNESIFLFDSFVIKFFYSEEMCKNRVLRGNSLGKLTPKILDFKDNFYKYEYAKGDLFSTVVNENLFDSFLEWSLNNLWHKKSTKTNFYSTCDNFYFDKSVSRINSFLKEHNIVDSKQKINGYDVPPVLEMLNGIDKDWMCKSTPYQFHGDYILDNIIYEGNLSFKLLDWRQDFGGDLYYGDIYYDLAKLNHNLLFNHDIVNEGHYNVKSNNGEIRCDILRSDILSQCRKKLHYFIEKKGYDLKKVKVLTSLVWLNMAPLHEPRMGRFLFYLGKINLYKSLEL